MAASNDDQLRDMLMQRTNPGLRAHTQRVHRYNAAYDIWRANPPKNTRLPKWRAQIRVPYAQASVDSALVNIVAGQPLCIVHPRHPDDEQGAKAMQAVLDYYVAEDHMVEKQPLFAQQALVYGITIAKNHWYYRENAGGEATVDRPCFEPWNAYDAWWDPNGRDVDSCEYIVLGSWQSKEQLLKRAYDPETGRGYRNLDSLFAAGPPPNRPVSAQETFLGNVDTKRKDAFLVEEFWYDDKLIVIGNRSVVLQVMDNPYGFKPIVIAQTRPDLFELAGISEIDLIRDIQAALQTLQNMTIDSLHVTVHPMFTLRDTSGLDPNLAQLRPGGIVPVSDHDDFRPMPMPPLDQNVYQERQRLMGDMERVTGITPYVQGTADTGGDQTATTTTTLASAANQGLKFKAAQLHWRGYQRTFEQWGRMIQMFQTQPVWAKITGENGEPAWHAYGNGDIRGDFHYRLEGSEEALSKQTARQEALALLNTLTPYVQMGVVDAKTLIERVAQAFDVPNPESLFKQQPPPPPAAPGLPPGVLNVVRSARVASGRR